MTVEAFAAYWFGCFAVVAVLGGEEGEVDLRDDGREWGEVVAGTYYVKSNYPGMYGVDG